MNKKASLAHELRRSGKPGTGLSTPDSDDGTLVNGNLVLGPKILSSAGAAESEPESAGASKDWSTSESPDFGGFGRSPGKLSDRVASTDTGSGGQQSDGSSPFSVQSPEVPPRSFPQEESVPAPRFVLPARASFPGLLSSV